MCDLEQIINSMIIFFLVKEQTMVFVSVFKNINMLVLFTFYQQAAFEIFLKHLKFELLCY
jgi:hypothetical protein